MVVIFIVNHEKHLLRALVDTGASSSIILDENTSAPFIEIGDSKTTTCSTIGGTLTTTKTGICL
jgi:predicted aspartyl protease